MAKKLLYIINHVDWFWTHRLALALAAKEAGYDVHVAVEGSSGDDRFSTHGFTAYELPGNPLQIVAEIKKITGMLQPDLIHAVTLKYSFLAGLGVPKIFKKRCVFTIAGLGYLFSGEGFRPKILRRLVKPLLRGALKDAQVIVQNPDDRDLLIRQGIIREATLVRSSGVDTAQFNPVPGQEEKPPVVLMATRLVRDKGVIVFIEAARLLKSRGVNARFLLAGGMEGHNPNTISESEMKELNKDGAVEWLGRVEDMPALYARASVMAYPSYYREGVPKVLLEAAASGKAIVTTDHPGCREVVTDGDNGFLVPVKDVPATADAIEKLLNDPVLRAKMGAHGRQRAEEEFAVEHIVRETLAVYQKI